MGSAVHDIYADTALRLRSGQWEILPRISLVQQIACQSSGTPGGVKVGIMIGSGVKKGPVAFGEGRPCENLDGF